MLFSIWIFLSQGCASIFGGKRVNKKDAWKGILREGATKTWWQEHWQVTCVPSCSIMSTHVAHVGLEPCLSLVLHACSQNTVNRDAGLSHVRWMQLWFIHKQVIIH